MYGDEVANGYDELQDAQDYQKCFEYEINKRLVLGKTPVAIDKDFLSNLQNGLVKPKDLSKSVMSSIS
jgi:lysyl-tRNA synthetase class 2